jgi:hypothetical protein
MRNLCACLLIALASACQGGDSAPSITIPDAVSHDVHFPIGTDAAGQNLPHTLGTGTPAISCDSCHGQFDTFTKFDCLSCHAHQDPAPLALTHRGMTNYAYNSDSCYRCHSRGVASGAVPSGLIADPLNDVTVTVQHPTWAATTITSFAAQVVQLPMSMDHAAKVLDPGLMTSCSACHANAGAGTYIPGVLHASLSAQGLPQPATCTECHGGALPGSAEPQGFVGPAATNPVRDPSSGEMKHAAVVWTGSKPGTALAAPAECALCHVAPTATAPATWSTSQKGATPAAFHASLGSAAAAQQPSSCLDCHANTRPKGVVNTPGALGGGTIAFDHSQAAALVDCAACHLATATAAGFSKWSGGGTYHVPGAAAPNTCLPCHAGERPTTTAGWTGSYANAPFDYVPNAQGITHGAGQDCVTCHTGPGTGTWGGTPKQNWEAGHFNHATSTLAKQGCITCHSTQRADLNASALTPAQVTRLAGFDHGANGNGDCYGCHQASVTGGAYASYATDWQGGKAYPGTTPVGAPSGGLSVSEISLLRTGSMVTGTSVATAKYFLNMVHTSSAIPAQVSPGPESAPNNTSCWHCHTHALNSTTVTSYSEGNFHGSLAGYQATPGGAVTPLAEPSKCLECHLPMRPQNIVEPLGSDLRPMDHAAVFTAPVVLGGVSVTGVAGMDCGLCHKPPATAQTQVRYSDGVFHASIGAAQPADCTVCHYTLMADAPRADLTGATKAKMSHGSPQLTFQDCQKCHTGALAAAPTTTAGAIAAASTLWVGGKLHAGMGATQPKTCGECHAGAAPAVSTASAVTYTFASGGGTTSNGAQWMNHAAGDAVSKDCSVCHLADAKASGAAWSTSDRFHTPVPAPASCQQCHGLTNGNGSVQGTKNNLPAGVSASATKTTAGTTTGVPAATLAQFTHADVNVSSKDCNVCHSAPTATTPLPVNKEWAQATFHSHFIGTPLVMNGTTGRCSSCHVGEKPTAAAFTPSHSGFTTTSAQDCASCHKYGGTGTNAAPNWLGATGAAPALMSLGGYTIPPGAGATQPVVNTAPHSTNTTCTACHTGGAGAKNAIGYDHSSTVASCNTCHEAGSNDLSPVWNGATAQASGLGDTRPYTLTATRPTWKSCTWSGGNHFYPADCKLCHTAPSGVSVGATTSSANASKWRSTGHPATGGFSRNSGWCAQCHQHGCD